MLFGTPRRDACEGEAKSPPPSKANGTETEGFPSPQAVMKEDMLKGMTPTEESVPRISIEYIRDRYLVDICISFI